MKQTDFITKACQDDLELIPIILNILAEQDSTLANAIEKPLIHQHLDRENRGESKELAVGDTIKSYTIIQTIGMGGMGYVYSAQQNYPAERKVALKLIKESLNQDLLLREIQILAGLNHPNIATLFEIGSTDHDQTFVAMELVDGCDLLSWSDENGLDKQKRLDLFLQLCEGISYAHERGVIHCDIKPSNVLVTEINGTHVVKIIDFGISQYQNYKSEHNTISGTPSYMAPEVLHTTEKIMADTRRDIYSLGVLFKKLLVNYLMTKDLQAIAEKATAIEASNRYAAVALFAADIESYKQQIPISARTHSLLYTTPLFIKRRLGVVLFSVALLIAIIAGYVAQAQQASIATEQARMAKSAQLEAEELATFLTELFNVANPEKGKDTSVTAQELLNNAKEQLLSIETPSLLDARFMHTIGSIFTRMGRYDDAEVMIDMSLQIKRRQLAENNDEVISGIN
ncbi:MAG: serine/threonine protein kinase, partial [Xanthomonadales bacterium]|nr:serine/threonine protein kinase [Xanthomonadales bacterium]